MDSIINIAKNYNEYREILFDLFVDYYGHEYRDLIYSRTEDVPVDLSSTPVDNYYYLKSHSNNISNAERGLIEKQYNDFESVMNEARNINYDLMFNFLVEVFRIQNRELGRLDKESFLSLFTDKTFSKSLIDGFSKQSLKFLNDDFVSENDKISILKKQEEFNRVLSNLGVNLDSFSNASINKVIEYRKKLKENYRNLIIKNSEYGQNMNSGIKSIIGIDVKPEFLNPIGLARSASAVSITVNRGSELVYYRYVKIPLIYLINRNLKGLDYSIIHELIHIIESYMNYVGISIHDETKTNKIVNEIRTQKLAAKFTKILHERGIFLYDNPKDYKVDGVSTYEFIYPLIGDFLDKYESVFSACAISNDIAKLNMMFGESWPLYSEYINDVFARTVNYYENFNTFPAVNMDVSTSNLIKSMEAHYERGKKYF